MDIRQSFTYYYVAYLDTKEVFYKNPTLKRGYTTPNEIYFWFNPDKHIIIADDAPDELLLEYRIYTQDELDDRKYQRLLAEGVNPALLKMIEELEEKVRNITVGGVPVLTTDIIAEIDCGSVTKGELIPAGTDIEELAKRLLLETYFPTFSNPSIILQANIPDIVESGSIYNITLTVIFNRGLIKGDMVGGVWNPDIKQNDRSGPLTGVTIENVQIGVNTFRTINNKLIEDGSNVFSSDVSYDVGPQPLDSKDMPYSTPLLAGSLSATKTIGGRRRMFYGIDSIGNSSNEIRGLQYNYLNPVENTEVTLTIPIGATNVVFAYPASLRDVSSVNYIEAMNIDVKNAFNKSIVDVAGVSGYNPIPYKVYIFTPAEPFDAVCTYKIKI